MPYVLVVCWDGDYEAPDIHGPFATLEEATDYAEEYREAHDLPREATSENNDIWTDAGWYFGIVQPRRDQ